MKDDEIVSPLRHPRWQKDSDYAAKEKTATSLDSFAVKPLSFR